MMDIRVKYTAKINGVTIPYGDYTAARGNALANDVARELLASGAGEDITRYPLKSIARMVDIPEPTIIDPATGLPVAIGGSGIPLSTIPPGQSAKVTTAVKNAGTMLAPCSGWTVAGSGTSGTDYSVDNAYSGLDASGNINGIRSRTGASTMLKLKGLTNTGVPRIQLTGNLGVFNGLFGIWVYIEPNPSGDPQPVGGQNLQISIAFSTNSGALWDQITYAFTTNGVKLGGWNFLAVARAADPISNTDKERHPFGITETINTFENSAWKTQSVRGVFIDVINKQGWTLYFDRAVHSWDAEPRFVIGADVAGLDTRDHFLRLMQDNGWGQHGYLAVPCRVSAYSELDYLKRGPSAEQIGMQAAYDAGWDLINHSVNHMPAATLTAAQNRFEIEGNRAWHHMQGYYKGQEFYASPTSSTNILSRKVIADCGIVLQRHSMRDATHVTAYGVDNMAFIGSVDIGANSWLLNGSDNVRWPYNYNHITNLRNWVDMIIKYKATGFAFFHTVTTLGDPGDGTGNSGDSVTMYESTLRLFLEHIKVREGEGKCEVSKGISGWYYGV